jgi:hypothetical protein
VKVLPSDSDAFIDPETLSELFQLKLTGLEPVAVEPNPVPIVVQPVASTTSSGSPSFTVGRIMSLLLCVTSVRMCRRFRGSMLDECVALTSRHAANVSNVTRPAT